MRKLDPHDVLADFDIALQDVELMLAAALPVTSGGPRDRLAEAAFLTAGVLWEGFLSDLFVAYLNRDVSGYANTVQSAISQSAASKYGSFVKGLVVQLRFPRFRGHPRRRENARGVFDVTTEEKNVHARVQG